MAADSKPTFRSYLSFILSSPLATWWAVATGVIEMVGFGLIAKSVVLSKWWLLILLLVVSFSIMTALLVLWKGWSLYSDTFERVSVSEIVLVEDGHMFLLEGPKGFDAGSVLEVYRTIEGVDVSIGLIQTTLQKDDGTVQAEPVWIKASHLRDIETGTLSDYRLRACPTLNLNNDTMSRWIDDEANEMLDELMSRGT